jgi:hypothetical protein
VGVTPHFLRTRADACDLALEETRTTLGAAEDAGEDLGSAARGWSFTGSLDDLLGRFEQLNEEMRKRLATASDNFHRSADAYEENEVRTAAEFLNIQR